MRKERKIRSVSQLRAAYPELTQQLVDQANLKNINAAVQAERRRILGLAALHFGRTAAEKFGRIAKIFDPPSN